MPNLTDVLNGEDKPTIENIASDLFTNDEGVAYTDLLAVGANPTAKIYRDGTVIGSTDNGSYVRWANGELKVYGLYKSQGSPLDVLDTAEATLIFPIKLSSISGGAYGISIGLGRSASSDIIDFVGVLGITVDDITLYKQGTPGINSGDIIINGRWI